LKVPLYSHCTCGPEFRAQKLRRNQHLRQHLFFCKNKKRLINMKELKRMHVVSVKVKQAHMCQ
jgi:hypothetical protein